ncbi:hypothetical protein GMRT_10159 [Giardia muris]|uniref:Uncharacterized protein n=1 Tax=Giardia muris TaxID=5742 RepID=A0A4Z1SM67_GIAMU|nr:hypothetical protein GMRT_10159 [Giardia muris]|eukprot:TNJ26772.1 hypothetical protein GMRT_10159 [Giardia muris]
MDSLMAALRQATDTPPTLETLQGLCLHARALPPACRVPEGVSEGIYALGSMVFAIQEESTILAAFLRLVALSCHCESLAGALLGFGGQPTTYGLTVEPVMDFDALDQEKKDGEQGFFDGFGFGREYSPPDRLIYLILGLVDYELYKHNPGLFMTAILALEGLSFYLQGKKRILFAGGLEVLTDVICELHEHEGCFDYRVFERLDGGDDLTLPLLETLSNLMTYRLCRVICTQENEKILVRSAERLQEPLFQALGTCRLDRHAYAITLCILPCLLEASTFYGGLKEREDLIEKLLRIGVSGEGSGAKPALLACLILTVDCRTRNPVVKIALHGEVGAEAAKAQALAEENFIKSASPSPGRKLGIEKAVMEPETEERCNLILKLLKGLLDTSLYIDLERAIQYAHLERDAFNTLFFTLHEAELSTIREIQDQSLPLLDGLLPDSDSPVHIGAPRSAPRLGPIGAGSATRSGAQSRLGALTTGRRGIAVRPGACKAPINLAKNVF